MRQVITVLNNDMTEWNDTTLATFKCFLIVFPNLKTGTFDSIHNVVMLFRSRGHYPSFPASCFWVGYPVQRNTVAPQSCMPSTLSSNCTPEVTRYNSYHLFALKMQSFSVCKEKKNPKNINSNQNQLSIFPKIERWFLKSMEDIFCM